MKTLKTKVKLLITTMFVTGTLFLGAWQAQALTLGLGAGATIPDSDSTGVSTDIVLSGGGTVTGVSVTITNLFHTWNGDLIFSLLHVETGTSVDLFNRPGVPAGAVGDSTNLGGTFLFSDLGSTSLDTAVDPLGGDDVLAGGSFFASTANGSKVFFSTFDSESVAGSWRLTASDNAGADTGSFGGWTLAANVSSVPEPSIMLLLGSGLFGLAVSRRINKKA